MTTWESVNNYLLEKSKSVVDYAKKSGVVVDYTKQAAIVISSYIQAHSKTFVHNFKDNPLMQKEIEAIWKSLERPTLSGIKKTVEQSGMIIAAVPGLTQIFISALIKVIGFTAVGVKKFTLAAMIQSKVYGGFIAKKSIFAYLQSYGALGMFDPTMITLLLLGGVIFYYFMFYSSGYKLEHSKWRFKDCLEKPSLTVPKSVKSVTQKQYDNSWKSWIPYWRKPVSEKVKFDIQWSHLSEEQKYQKYLKKLIP